MLLVNDHESETPEDHVVFYDCMGAYEDVDVASEERVQHLLAFLPFHCAGEELNPYWHIAQHLAKCLNVLFCKDFCRCHDACLASVVEREERHHKCNQSLSAADIALQETVHLPARFHVCMNLFDDAFLRSREREG